MTASCFNTANFSQAKINRKRLPAISLRLKRRFLYGKSRLRLYHYAGNNPLKYTDPDGKYVINNVAQGAKSAREYALQQPMRGFDETENYFGKFLGAYVFVPGINSERPSMAASGLVNIILPNNMNQSLKAAIRIKNDSSEAAKSKIKANAIDMHNGKYEIQITVSISGLRDSKAAIAFAGEREIMTNGKIDQSKIDKIANETINIIMNQNRTTQNID